MFVIGTAGHVDHGKSLLVERLTGIDPDRLREEKVRGMTIDLGFAWLALPSGRAASIIDVPGHERFIKNMLAGAGGVDLALLVVAADDGVMPQTREHLAILDLLGVRRGVVALTKIDLADDAWAQLVTGDIKELLGGTGLEGAPVVPCSSVTGAGVDALIAALDAALAELPPKRNSGRPRLPIDRVFTIDGFGTVVTGTLIDGELATGDEVEAVPSGQRGRIRGLQSHGDRVERALPGTRTAVNVTGIERAALRRGMVLAPPGQLAASGVLDARVRVLGQAAHPLRHNMHLTFHCLAEEANAHLRLLESDELAPGSEGWATIRFAGPVAVRRGDRFVLRTANDTVAGGIVVDIAPRRHRRRDSSVIEALEAATSESPAELVRAAVTDRPGLPLPEIAEAAGCSPSDAEGAIAELAAAGDVILVGDGSTMAVAATFEADVHARTRELLDAFHRQHRLRAGMPTEELRSRLGIDPRLLNALLRRWEDVAADASTVAMAGFHPSLDSRQQERADAFLAALRASPFHPPAADGIGADVLAYLGGRGEIVDTGDGVIFEAAAFDEMRRRVEERVRRDGSITLAQARDELGTSRRYVQSLLEHLDRLRVTVRRGEVRVLR